MRDIQIWEYVLKWGIAQNPELPSDPSNYSKDDFNTLKNTLQQFIPLIKFFNMTPKEYLDKVHPYKKIIPKDLREKLFKYFINKPELDSKIITIQHAELISKCIDRLGITDKTYEFKLILRGSRDGFSSSKFHEICDNQSHTVTIIKVKDSDEILGGYNPIIWKSDFGYSATKDSFIFSFRPENNMILSRVRREDEAIYNNPDFGPSFGDGLVLCGNYFYNWSYCYNNRYEKHIRPFSAENIRDNWRATDGGTNNNTGFSVEEYEVFQIIATVW